MTEQFAFSEQEREAIAEIFWAAPSDGLNTLAWRREQVGRVEAVINRVRAGDPVGTIRQYVHEEGVVTAYAINTKKGYFVQHLEGDCVGPVEDVSAWPVVYRPEADS